MSCALLELLRRLDGRYRSEHLLELRCGLQMWQKYQEMIALVDQTIAAQLRSMRKQMTLPRRRGRKPHDP